MCGHSKTPLPPPPYYAVVFTSQRTEGDRGYSKMAERLEEMASQQQGFLGIESARDSGLGITVSYWESLDAIRNWKENSSHKFAQEKGKEEWYKNYTVRVCKVEKAYSFEM
ncbi:antibiotic biosynthesis monooxygenase [Bacillus sp. FJAT-49736]|uniref:antibiotic biosynthesis monooxygenase family protein n=1 Tax=Bacillus sp. FJAT-49736 TaxID=2833582 RepID=UPI001BC9081F|nr:antibiotic biosynthesis monooxygenase [Bacillus sp. FJAT-49736]MBS4172775.1 antibiotic biosynthesis monooxygenase [Bacillus sp. FJAT-49736]